MEILKFTLSGMGATFTRPSFNSINSSYSHIHKVALLGIFGAITGIDKTTHTQGTLPPFYETFKDLKVSIVPSKTVFYNWFPIITCTNGFANKNTTFLQTYETLINPSWDIYVPKSENQYYEKLKNCILNRESHFIPYLGKNHLFANITNMEVLEGELVDEIESIDSLFIENDIETELEEDDFDFDLEFNDVYFREYMPVKFKEEGFIQYIEEPLVFTNRKVVSTNTKILQCNNKNLYLI